MVPGKISKKQLVCLAIIGLIVLLFAYSRLDRTGSNLANGARIVAALDRYKVAHGQYPSTLDALIPMYLDEIPAAHGRGMEWSYHPFAGASEFKLAFYSEAPRVIIGNYRSDERGWVTID